MDADDSTNALTAAVMSASFGFDLVLQPSVVLVVDSSLVPARSATRVQRKAAHPFRQVGSLHAGVDIVQAVGPGAPVAAITAEFLAHFGARRVVLVGSAGRLREPEHGGLPTQNVVASAVSDEGTSAHFGTDLTADQTLTTALSDLSGAPVCTTLTTDVPFRHSPGRLSHHRSRAEITEMECAALFAASRHFGLQTAALLATSDVFATAGWRPLDRTKVEQALHQAVQTATQVLAHTP